jgi:hypothetical protein
VTVLEGGLSRTRITVSELALRGFGDGFGFWIRVGERCLVLSLDQQYQP